MNGERFYLLQDESALKQHDETHIFQVGFDGEALVGELDEALALLADEASGGATSTATCILQTGPIGAPQTEKGTPSPNGSEWACSC